MFQASFQALKESSTVHRACPFRELAFNGRQVGATGLICLSPLIASMPVPIIYCCPCLVGGSRQTSMSVPINHCYTCVMVCPEGAELQLLSLL